MRSTGVPGKRIGRVGTDDRGSIALNTIGAMVLLMIVAMGLAKSLGPSLHTIAARDDVKRAGTLTSLAGTYVLQTGDTQPTIAKLVSDGLLPAGAKGVCAGCNGGNGTYTTNDGSVISLLPGATSGIYQMTLVPGSGMSKDTPYYLSHLTGSIQNGSAIQWNQPVPALANLGGQFVQKNPSNPSTTQSVNSSLLTNGTISSIGPVQATNDTMMAHGVMWYWWNPPAYSASGGVAGYLGYNYWPAPNYWWYNVPGYSGCGGQNPSGGVTLPWGRVQVYQIGSCNNWEVYVGPNSYP